MSSFASARSRSRRLQLDSLHLQFVFQRGTIGPFGIDQRGDETASEAGGGLFDAIDFVDRLIGGLTASEPTITQTDLPVTPPAV